MPPHPGYVATLKKIIFLQISYMQFFVLLCFVFCMKEISDNNQFVYSPETLTLNFMVKS